MKRTQPESRAGDPSLRAAMRQALEYFRQGQWLRAEGLCQLIVEKHPEHVQALQLFGELCFAQGRMEEALALAERVRALRPRDAATLYNLGTVLAALGRHAEALVNLDAALRERPRDTAALINRANVLQALTRHDEALASLDAALAVEPRSAQGHYNRGNVLQAMGRFEDAVIAYDRALALQANYADALINRGNALQELDRYEDSIASYDEALAINNQRVDALYNRGNALRAILRDREALASYDRAIEIDPNHADARCMRALLSIALGDFERGWFEYEWRWKTSHLKAGFRNYSQPLWLGQRTTSGQRILLYAEQGLGDTLQFVRYAPLLSDRGLQVFLEVQAPLKSLLARMDERLNVFAEGETIPPFDIQCPLMSLPLAFGTRVDTVPADVPYLTADPSRVERWRNVIGDDGCPKVGVAWSGNASHRNDRNRSIPFRYLKDLLELPQMRFFSLQKDIRANDEALVRGDGRLVHFGADFEDTAALISIMDVIISVDTAIAHLAGALGRPVWIPLMYSADWRWLRGRPVSPWYPTARIFRQAQRGKWEDVIAQIRSELARSDFETT
jgi:tetratricopeptide (TPR) repeat protein